MSYQLVGGSPSCYFSNETLDEMGRTPLVSVLVAPTRIIGGVVKASLCGVAAAYSKMNNGNVGPWGDRGRDGLNSLFLGILEVPSIIGGVVFAEVVTNYKMYQVGINSFRARSSVKMYPETTPFIMETYEGEFYKGKRHGEGTYTRKNGTSFSGRWEKGLFMDKKDN